MRPSAPTLIAAIAEAISQPSTTLRGLWQRCRSRDYCSSMLAASAVLRLLLLKVALLPPWCPAMQARLRVLARFGLLMLPAAAFPLAPLPHCLAAGSLGVAEGLGL